MILKNPKLFLVAMLLVESAVSSPASPADGGSWLEPYNIVWSSQSRDSSESMPCGGGDTGLNVWVQDGDLLCYAQRSGCYDENNELLKLGRLRIHLDPNPFVEGCSFRQELKLRQGSIEIEADSGNLGVIISVWADVFRPVVHIEISARRAVQAIVSYESWRTNDLVLPPRPDRPRPEFVLGRDAYPGRLVRYHDEVVPSGDSILFYHRNRSQGLLFDYVINQQHLSDLKDEMVNTQQGRTFGGVVLAKGFVPFGIREGSYGGTAFRAFRLRSEKPSRTHSIELITQIAQTASLEAWKKALDATIVEVDKGSRRRETLDWWDAFWARSHIVISPDRPDEASVPWQIARNYQLVRYQMGCNVQGEFPTRHGGGNLTFDPSFVANGRSVDLSTKHVGDPDSSSAGGAFWAQNQRLLYWPLLKSGDADVMLPQLEFYRRTLPNAMARVKAYYGHGGCLFAEAMENFGLPYACGWGWTEPGAVRRQRGEEIAFGDPRADGTHGYGSLVERGEQANEYVSYHYEGQLEFSYMALERYRYFGGDLRPFMPFIEQSVRFFDEHYQLRQKMRTGQPLDIRGKLVIYPSTSLESYRGARNPVDLIAGLSACLESLLSLPDDLVPAQTKAYYRAYRDRLPDYTYRVVQGDRVIEPAESYQRYQNFECPQFYPLFPFDRFALENDNLDVFRNTWKHGTFAKNMVMSWHQDGIFFARMGLTAEAAEFNSQKLKNSARRFPTFWGPGHDWVPDHNWGGSGMIGLQEMLMQTVGRRIVLLPAWPASWDCDFKLHAPYQTIVEGKVRAGKITSLKVTPDGRSKDVIVRGEEGISVDQGTRSSDSPGLQRSSSGT